MDNKQAEKDTYIKWYKKINWTSTKNLKLIGLVIALIVVLVLYFNLTSSKKTTATSISTASVSRDYMTTVDYTNYLENKIGKTISNMSGVSNVSVMVTLNGGVELELAENEDYRSNTTANQSNSTKNETRVSEPIIVSRNGTQVPLVLNEKLPDVIGVVVVARGASTKTRLDIINALKTLLSIPSANIQVFS